MSEERGRREKADSEAEIALHKLSEAEERVETAEKGWAEAKSKLDQLSEQLDNAKKGSGDLTVKLQAQLTAVKEQLSLATAKVICSLWYCFLFLLRIFVIVCMYLIIC